MTLVDSHCHLDLDRFDPDRQAVIDRAQAAGVEAMLVPALDLKSCRSVLSLAQTRPDLYAAIGVHPTEAASWDDRTAVALRQLHSADKGTGKIVAIGEIGLDYYWKTAPHELQQVVLQQQLSLAAELGLPVIIHFREKGDAPTGPCASDLLGLLEAWVSRLHAEGNPLAERPGVLHSFAGSRDTAQRAVELGFYIGVSGPLTYPQNSPRAELIAALPLERLLLETDSPFQAPLPHRRERNEPAYVRLIADKIALLRSLPLASVAEVTSRNASELFHWNLTV